MKNGYQKKCGVSKKIKPATSFNCRPAIKLKKHENDKLHDKGKKRTKTTKKNRNEDCKFEEKAR